MLALVAHAPHALLHPEDPVDLNTVEGEEHGLGYVWVDQKEYHDHGGDKLSSKFL